MLMVGKLGDYAGGFVSTGAFSVFVNDRPVARIGSVITPHDSDPVHKAVMLTGLPSVLVEDIPVSRNLDFATCGHPLVAVSNVEAG